MLRATAAGQAGPRVGVVAVGAALPAEVVWDSRSTNRLSATPLCSLLPLQPYQHIPRPANAAVVQAVVSWRARAVLFDSGVMQRSCSDLACCCCRQAPSASPTHQPAPLPPPPAAPPGLAHEGSLASRHASPCGRPQLWPRVGGCCHSSPRPLQAMKFFASTLSFFPLFISSLAFCICVHVPRSAFVPTPVPHSALPHPLLALARVPSPLHPSLLASCTSNNASEVSLPTLQ